MEKSVVKLKLGERLILGGVVRKYEGSYIDLVAIRDLIPKLEPTQEEISTCGIKMTEDGKGLIWDSKVESMLFEITITEFEKSVIAKALSRIESMGKLNLEIIPLYEKFCK